MLETAEIIEAPGAVGEALRFSGDGRPDDERRFGEGHANECEHHRCAGRVRERWLEQRSGGMVLMIGVWRRSGEAAWRGVGQGGERSAGEGGAERRFARRDAMRER